MNDKFEKYSSFYTKDGEWQEKMCGFTLIFNGEPMDTVSTNMAQYIE